MKINENLVYYDPRTKVVFTVKRILPSLLEIGGCTSPYLADAKTNICRYLITKEYFGGCQIIDETSPLVFNNGIGYLLKDCGEIYSFAEDSTNIKIVYKEGFRLTRSIELLIGRRM